ncbi:MAG TPA: hypothetical protein ENN03_00745 [bacterium]|nr:hypothetical protein [bacterium]
MKKTLLYSILIGLSFFTCTRDNPWLGTYMLQPGESQKDAFDMYRSMGVPWPQIVFRDDGTFLLIKEDGYGHGVYQVKKENLNLKLVYFGGKQVTGNDAETVTGVFENRYRVFCMNSLDSSRFVRQ